MGKIISAQSILKQKGFVQNKFDTNGFMNAVGQYFLDNTVESRLLLLPSRFLDIDRTLDEDGKEKCNPYDITPENERLGYQVEVERNPATGELVFAEKTLKRDFWMFKSMKDFGVLVPRIIIDKPFFENAAGVLRVMGGYVVEKRVTKKLKTYIVTLV